MLIKSPISIGELLDKISILMIKQDKIRDKDKLSFIQKELSHLLALSNSLTHSTDHWIENLKDINEKLWNIEDELRLKEQNQEFDKEFIELARQVYITNDLRFSHKNKINKAFNSEICEQKSYTQYATASLVK